MSSHNESRPAARCPSYDDIVVLDQADTARLPTYKMSYLGRDHPYVRWNSHRRHDCVKSPPTFEEVVIPDEAGIRARYLAAQAFFNQAPLPCEPEPATVDESAVPTATSTITSTSALAPAAAPVTGTLNHLGDRQIALFELPAEVRAFLENIPTVPTGTNADRLVKILAGVESGVA